MHKIRYKNMHRLHIFRNLTIFEATYRLCVNAKNGTTRSLDNILKVDNIPFGYKLVAGNCVLKGRK